MNGRWFRFRWVVRRGTVVVNMNTLCWIMNGVMMRLRMIPFHMNNLMFSWRMVGVRRKCLGNQMRLVLRMIHRGSIARRRGRRGRTRDIFHGQGRWSRMFMMVLYWSRRVILYRSRRVILYRSWRVILYRSRRLILYRSRRLILYRRRRLVLYRSRRVILYRSRRLILYRSRRVILYRSGRFILYGMVFVFRRMILNRRWGRGRMTTSSRVFLLGRVVFRRRGKTVFLMRGKVF